MCLILVYVHYSSSSRKLSSVYWGWDNTVSSRIDKYSIGTLPIRYIFDTIHVYVHDLRFQNQEQQSECFGMIYTVNPINAKAKAK